MLTKIIINAVQLQKQAFLKEAYFSYKNSSEYPEESDMQSCADLILKALDKERRASGLVPPVLHLIKTL